MAQRRNARSAQQLDPNLKENPAYKGKMEALMAAIIPEDFRKIDIAFPAYWKADVATGFRAIVLRREDPKLEVKEDNSIGIKEGPGQFSRYLWKNTGAPLDCRRGAVADGVIETVQVGSIFSTSAFAGLDLDKYFGCEIAVICEELVQLPGNKASAFAPRDFWRFATYMTDATRALVDSRKEEDMKFLQQAQREADQLAMAEMLRLNARKKFESHIVETTGVSR